MIAMKASVVVCTYRPKGPDTLSNLLQGLRAQTYRDMEIVIVIDGNEELYPKILELIKEGFGAIPVKVVPNKVNQGLSRTRNDGIKNASGDVVAFIDDDAIPDARWVEEIVGTFEKYPGIVAVVGEVLPKWEREDMAWFPRDLYWMISCSYTMTPKAMQEVERGFGVNMAFRRDALVKAGMFNADFGMTKSRQIQGDEISLFLKIKNMGQKVMFNPAAVVHHEVYDNRIAYKTVVRRAFNQGVTVGLYRKLPQYKVTDSTESRYLNELLFGFYPRCVSRFVHTLSSVEIKKAVYVTSVIIAQGAGYLYSVISGA